MREPLQDDEVSRIEIAEREKAKAAIYESYPIYRSLVEQLPVGLFRKDVEGRYILVNERFCAVRGKSANEILGKMPLEISSNPKEIQSEVTLFLRGANDHAQIIRTGQTIEVDESYSGPDGSTKVYHVVKSPVFDTAGKIIGSQGVMIDITARKEAEALLDKERNLLRALLDNTDDAVYFKDRDSRFIRCSSRMARVFGVPGANYLIGKRDSDFFSTAHAQEALDDERKIIESGKPLVGKVEKETWPDGHVTWVLTSKMPLRNEDGKAIGIFGISKDITGMRQAEEKLAETNRQLVDASRQAGMAEVATSVLHNVGNVLNSVNVSSSLIASMLQNSKIVNLGKAAALIEAHKDNLGDYLTNDLTGKKLPIYLAGLAANLTQEHQEALREVASLADSVAHIKEIVSMQQNYARAAGLTELLSAADVVEDAMRLNAVSMDRHQVKIIREFSPVPQILVEKHKALQILVNLLRNAKFACDESERTDKEITLRIANGSGRVKISVIDNGVGIPKENLTRIFNHGFTTRKEGHGFGLHSSAIAAKEMGGSLIAVSEGPGKGATFTLELPANKKDNS